MSQSFKLFFSPAAIGPLIAVVAAGCAPKIMGPGLPISPSSFSGTSASPADSAQVLLGKDFWDDTGTKVSGTMPLGANVASPNGQLSSLIPVGYYDGTQNATVSDTHLLAANIASGVSIFGVTGSASFESHINCTSSGQQGCVATSSFLAGAPQVNVTGANAQLGFAIPQGYYDGVKTATAADTNLVATNIKSGVSLFGVTGSVTAAYGACTDNALNAGQCSTSASRYVASALGSAVNGSNGSLSKAIPLGFYDGTTSCTMSDTGLVAGNIISGVSIFGVAGSISNYGNLNAANTWPGAGYYGATPTGAPTAGQVCSGTRVLGTAGNATCGGVILASNQHRDLATTQVSQSTETVTNAATLYTNADPGYRAIPKISKDDDGYTGGSVTMVSRTNWDTSCDSTTGAAGGSANSVCKCGLSGTITARIADCAAHGTIGTNATWDGATKGNAGQGAWKLVTRTAAVTSSMGREVWQDQRTLLLWSSKVSTALTWCKASGSNNIAGNPVAENDPSAYCVNATYQSTAGQAVSACFEDNGTNFTQTDGGVDSTGKGALNRISTPVVGWRLPTKYDYQAADNNGIRFVMPDMAAAVGGYEWSASVVASDRVFAWLFTGAYGYVTYSPRNLSYSVRCVGR